MRYQIEQNVRGSRSDTVSKHQIKLSSEIGGHNVRPRAARSAFLEPSEEPRKTMGRPRVTSGRGASPIDPVQIQNRIFPASSSPSNRVPRCELVFRKPPDPDVQKRSNINGRRYPYGLGILADMIRKPKRVALYLRVSTNGQSTENQKLE